MNTQETAGSVTLSLEDISLMVSIISTVSRRGAVAPEEFTIVGAFFDRLRSFLPVQEDTEDQDNYVDSEQAPTTVDAVNSGETNVVNVDFSGVKA